MIHVRSLYFGAHGRQIITVVYKLICSSIFKETQSNIPAMSIDSERRRTRRRRKKIIKKNYIYI